MNDFIQNYEPYVKVKPTFSTWFYRALYCISTFLIGWTVGGIIFKTLGFDKSNWFDILYPMLFVILIWSLVLVYKLIKELLK